MITDDQLGVWAKPGANATARDTYAAIRRALEASRPLMEHGPEIFLQGSYANSTNIRGDSDVDVVVMLGDQWVPDLSALSQAEIQRYRLATVDAAYTHAQFVVDVETALVATFGRASVTVKNKCIKVEGNDHRLDADVVPAHRYRMYTSVPTYATARYIEGTLIKPRSGGRIINFPKQHIDNGQEKNKATQGKYKDTVRQYKNMIAKAVRDGVLHDGQVPGYFTESLLSNVPDSTLASTAHTDRVLNVLDWIVNLQALEQLTSADGIHTLFRTDPGNWTREHVTALADGVIKVLR